jgi:RNA polymerase sigma factor (sigma-70 family)
MDATDAELLAAFARNRNEDAFRELVRRHLGMVFATARRLVGDAHEAEEITQTVFQLFAGKAGTIEAGQPLAGWFYHTTRHHALHRIRSEGRRRQREQLAADMNPATESAPPPPWIAELEDALTELPAGERDALVLRFLEDRQLREVGRELGVSEEAARKRVTRALNRLRDVFARRGITASTGAITVALLGQAGVGVPAGLGATITTTVLGGTAVAAATTALVTETTATTMNLINLKTAAAILTTAALTSTSTFLLVRQESVKEKHLISESATSEAPISQPSVANVITNPVRETVKLDWRTVESMDYRRYIQNMRDAAVPEQTIADIIIADVNALFKPEFDAIKHKLNQERLQYWKTGGRDELASVAPEILGEYRNLMEQKKRLLKELLGTDAGDEEADLLVLKDAHFFIAPERRAAVVAIEQRYEAESAVVPAGPDWAVRIAEIMKRKYAEIASVLTPEEKHLYDALLSPQASLLRMELQYFSPTKEEFDAIFGVRQKLDHYLNEVRIANAHGDDRLPEDVGERSRLQQQELLGLLGQDRFEQYERSRDPVYRSAVQLTESAGISGEVATAIYRLRQDATRAYVENIAKHDLQGQQREDALRLLRDVAEAEIRRLIGDENYARYRREPAVIWAERISSGIIPGPLSQVP